MKSVQLTSIPQPTVCAPPHIKAEVSEYEYDSRITMITFSNEGNLEAPTQLKPVALVPTGVAAHVLRMMGEVSIYQISPDSVVELITITLGVQNVGERKVDVLVAVLDLISLQDGTHRITHGCSVFD